MPRKVFWEALNQIAPRPFTLTELGEETAEWLAKAFVIAQKSVTLQGLREIFPIPLVEEQTHQEPLAVRVRIGYEPGPTFRLTQNDFNQDTATSRIVQEMAGGAEIPVRTLVPAKAHEVSSLSSVRVDLMELPIDWFTVWPSGNYEDMRTGGGLVVVASSRFQTVKAKAIIGDVFFVQDCTASTIDCDAVSSKPIAILNSSAFDNSLISFISDKTELQINLASLLPFCANPDVLENLIEKKKAILIEDLTEDTVVVYEAGSERGSKVTIPRGGFMTTRLLAVETKAGAGFTSTGRLVGVKSVAGTENQFIELIGNRPTGQVTQITRAQWHDNSGKIARRIALQEPHSQKSGNPRSV
jgi:hypothetical protein